MYVHNILYIVKKPSIHLSMFFGMLSELSIAYSGWNWMDLLKTRLHL